MAAEPIADLATCAVRRCDGHCDTRTRPVCYSCRLQAINTLDQEKPCMPM